MKAYATESIRNLAVIGHGDAGKTQLISSLLYVAGATPRWGKVQEGTTVTDYETIAGNVVANPNKTLHFVDSTADRAITLPSAAPVTAIHLFLDITHSAATHPSTFDVQSSGTIDGNSTVVVADNRYFRSFVKIATSSWVFAG